MLRHKIKRALVLVGAGASLDFGAPSTSKLTETVKAKVLTDEWMRHCASDSAYRTIDSNLAGYLRDGASAVNFEHIFHCAHELLSTFEPCRGAVNEFRPLLHPFVLRQVSVDKTALEALVRRMGDFIFETISEACAVPSAQLDPLTAFLAKLRLGHITRIYTTNYDDFFLQASPDLYTGFDRAFSSEPKRFDAGLFWRETDADSIFHLHGSVHLSFGAPLAGEVDLGTLRWFDDRAAALAGVSQIGSGNRRMDGSETIPTAVITGLDKLSRLQQAPLSHYYACMAKDALTADVIYVIGSGLTDLHLNTWLGEARRRSPMPPLVFVDWWPKSFLSDTALDVDRKQIEMLHKLRMLVGTSHYSGILYGHGWTLARDRSCAVWDKGFLKFLEAPAELEHILKELT